MSEQTTTYQQALSLINVLSPLERLQLAEVIMATLRRDLPAASARPPRRSLYGALANLNLDVSDDDIADARRAMMQNFRPKHS